MALVPKIDLKTGSRQIFLPVIYEYILLKLLSGEQTKLEEGDRKQRRIQGEGNSRSPFTWKIINFTEVSFLSTASPCFCLSSRPVTTLSWILNLSGNADKAKDEEEKKNLKRIIVAILEWTKLKDWLFTYLLNNHRIPLSWRCDYARIWGEFAQTAL